MADRAILAAVFGDHPYGHGALGTTRSLEAMTLDEVRDALGARPGDRARATLLVAGDVTPAASRPAAVARFGDWDGASLAAGCAVGPPAEPPDRRVRLIDRPGAPQSEVRVGHRGPPRRTPDYHALLTLNALLGGQFTSRINRNLREARAITYGARSSFEMRRAGGLFSCDTSVQADATADAVERDPARVPRGRRPRARSARTELAHAPRPRSRAATCASSKRPRNWRARWRSSLTYDLDRRRVRHASCPPSSGSPAAELTRAARDHRSIRTTGLDRGRRRPGPRSASSARSASAAVRSARRPRSTFVRSRSLCMKAVRFHHHGGPEVLVL